MKRAWIFLLLVQSARAGVSDLDATNAIVGEAAGAPYIVKLGVAAAIHNRNSLRGVYGFHAKHNATEPAWVWRDAARAWAESAAKDPTHGAVNFGCRADVDMGTFRGLHLTAVLGTGKHSTYFFKP